MLRSTASSTRRFSARRLLSSSLSSSTNTSPNSGFASAALKERFSNLNVLARSMSSFAEPGTLFNGEIMTQIQNTAGVDSNTINDEDRDAPLRADIRAMGALLGQIVQDHHGKDIFEKIEELRGLSKQWREAGAGRDANQADKADNTFAELTKACAKLSNEEILVIARAFNFFLSIANAAEGHHRIRRLNMATREEALPDRYDSW